MKQRVRPPLTRHASSRTNFGDVLRIFYELFTDFLFLCSVRAKQETYQDEAKMKYTIMKVLPIDYVQDTTSLLEEISRYQ